jgi:hypothetical protein
MRKVHSAADRHRSWQEMLLEPVYTTLVPEQQSEGFHNHQRRPRLTVEKIARRPAQFHRERRS